MTSQFHKGTAVKMAAHRNAIDRESHKGVVATGKVVMRKSEHPSASWKDSEPFLAVRWDDSGITTFEPVRRLALLTVLEREDRAAAMRVLRAPYGRASGKKCSARIKVKVKARCACSGRSSGASRSRELAEMRTLLQEKGYSPRDAEALHAEGMGSYELEHRLKERGGLERTHGLRKGRSSGVSKAYDAEILAGMARGPWAIDWANRQEERGRRLGQVDIYEAAPRTPAWAMRWARDAAGRIVKASRATTLTELYERVQELGFRKDAERFGLYLSAGVTGEGISWTDDVSAPQSVTDAAISIPRGEFYQRAAKSYTERY